MQSAKSAPKQQEDLYLQLLSSIDENIHNIKSILDTPSDLITREFTIGNTHHRCAIVYLDGLADKMVINDPIIKNIQIESVESEKELSDKAVHLVDQLYNEFLSVGEVKKSTLSDEILYSILSGDTALYVAEEGKWSTR
ncbi:spore germination protein [Peribacillus butanolivorans]|uniref:spore germination protein n=1 Tax=Peribacillus butanolivorans TaxID=421767 RepID=UPI00365AACD2